MRSVCRGQGLLLGLCSGITLEGSEDSMGYRGSNPPILERTLQGAEPRETGERLRGKGLTRVAQFEICVNPDAWFPFWWKKLREARNTFRNDQVHISPSFLKGCVYVGGGPRDTDRG